MKVFLFSLFFISHIAIASPQLSHDKLNEIVELFINGSKESATQELIDNEDSLIKGLGDNGATYLLLGRAYFYAELDSKAKGVLIKALSYDEKLHKAHYFIGLIYMYANEFQLAADSFKKAISIDGSRENYFVELGRMQEKLSDTNSAMSQYIKALNINHQNYTANLKVANIYTEKKDFINAEKHYLEALKIKPENLLLNYNLGQLYQSIKKHDLALNYFSKVVKLDPLDWRAVAKIVQESEAVGNIPERDRFIVKIYNLWAKKDLGDLKQQGFFIREQSVSEQGKIFALEYFEMVGERAKKFVFKVQDLDSGELIMDISLGSYESTTIFSRESGSIGEDERLYHLDGYLPNGTHYTYGFFNKLPSYAKVKEMVFEVLAGKHKVISSTVPANANNTP